MALPEKRDELSRSDEQTAVKRLDEQSGRSINTARIEEHYRVEDRTYGEQQDEQEHRRHGHEFGKDVHPERYPRESLSRLEEGIFEDDEVRRIHDRLAFSGPDMESRVEESRNLSRTLMVLGMFLLIFAWVLLLWVGWDVRSGEVFFSTMCVVSIAVGLGLMAWGFIERQRVMRLRAPLARPIEEHIERIRREHELREGSNRAA